jgi:hypothetical protein
MEIGKSLRFEIFARDVFTCQYCGQRPPDVILEADHIHPVSKGGSDDTINLITSCFDCNRGKRAKVISEVAPRPDADLAYMKVQQESAEIIRFLKAKKKRDKATKDACDALRDTWAQYLTPDIQPADRVLVPWIDRYGADEVEKAIIITAPSYTNRRFGFDDDSAFNKMLPYMGAILRNRFNDKEAGAIQ